MFGKLQEILFTLTLLSFVVFCPGAQCLGPTPPDGDPPPTSTGRDDDSNPGDNQSDEIIDPVIPGFTLAVKQGAFWQFGWTTEQRSWGYGDTTTSIKTGVFRIVLGNPTMIQGVPCYELIFEGNVYKFTPRWRYLAFRENQILGSEDGVSLVMLFDGLRGYWPASGLLLEFYNNTDLISATAGKIENDFITQDAIVVQTSFSAGGCQHYPGVGNICPSETRESAKRKEYYFPGVGPIGFYSYGYYSTRYGGSNTETHCGLTDFSLQPVDGLVPFEREPNNSPSQAQTIQIGTAVLASIEQSDAGSKAPPSADLTALSVSLNSPGFVNSVYADWFTFTVDTSRSITVDLEFSSNRLTDIDIILFDNSLNHVLGYSMRDNVREGGKYETITATLDPGTYYVGVLGFVTSNRVNYTLSVQ